MQTETMNNLLHYEKGHAMLMDEHRVKIKHEGEEKIIFLNTVFQL
jgi:hypothetical protein